MKKLSGFFIVVSVFCACTTNTKKIIVFIHDNPVINQSAKTISSKETKGHVVKNIEYNSAAPVVLNTTTSDGYKQITIDDNGYYILNLKPNDTIIGGYKTYSINTATGNTITQADLKQKIDSLQLLLEGKNISAANRNYFILPNTAVKITGNIDAIIVTPYRQMPAIEMKDNVMPEVYQFYTINEIRETIGKLQALTKTDDEEKKSE